MRALYDIFPYAITPRGRGYALWLDGDLVETGFPSEADAYGYAHDRLDADQADAAAQAEFEAEQMREAA